MTREGAGLSVAPGEEDKVDPEDLKQAQQWATERVSYPVRFLPYEEEGGKVLDWCCLYVCMRVVDPFKMGRSSYYTHLLNCTDITI